MRPVTTQLRVALSTFALLASLLVAWPLAATPGGLRACQAQLTECQTDVNAISPYDGLWELNATRVSGPTAPGCTEDNTALTALAVVDKFGDLLLAFPANASGTISSGGAVSFTSLEPPDPTASCPPGGGGSGSCASPTSCSGTYNSNEGSNWTWTLTR
jgi:hypothetical protein